MKHSVAQQYEAYPYPNIDLGTDTPDKNGSFTNDLSFIAHHLYGGDFSKYSGKYSVLVAGGGTGQATLHLAMQLSQINEKAYITHLDISKTSVEIVEKRIQNWGLKNIDVVHGSLLDLPNGKLGQFDFINCSGVLHHLGDPLAGARALETALKDNGAMNIMLYGHYGRRIIYDIQKMVRTLQSKGDDLESLIPLTHEVVNTLPQKNPLYADYLATSDDNELVDRYLHIQDRAYTVSQIYELLEEASLKLVSFLPKMLYDPKVGIEDKELLNRIEALSLQDQQSFAEIRYGAIDRHGLYVAKKGRRLPKAPDPENEILRPVLTGGAHNLSPFNFPQGATMTVPVADRLELHHLEAISFIANEELTIGSLISKIKDSQSLSTTKAKNIWLDVYRKLHGRGKIALKKT